MPYTHEYYYFSLPRDASAPLKGHIMRPHTDVPLCGQMKGDAYKPSYDLPAHRSLCAKCLVSLRAYLDSRGTEAVALHVYKALVDRLQKLEAPDGN